MTRRGPWILRGTSARRALEKSLGFDCHQMCGRPVVRSRGTPPFQMPHGFLLPMITWHTTFPLKPPAPLCIKTVTELLIMFQAPKKKKCECFSGGIRSAAADIFGWRTSFSFSNCRRCFYFLPSPLLPMKCYTFPKHQLDVVLLDPAALFQIWKGGGE